MLIIIIMIIILKKKTVKKEIMQKGKFDRDKEEKGLKFVNLAALVKKIRKLFYSEKENLDTPF